MLWPISQEPLKRMSQGKPPLLVPQLGALSCTVSFLGRVRDPTKIDKTENIIGYQLLLSSLLEDLDI